MRMGTKGSVSTDAHQMKISASLLSSRDMFVAISNSGETLELIEVEDCSQSRAYVVVITNFEGSALTKNADLVLITTAQSSNNDSKFINSQIATLFLLDIVSYLLLNDTHMHQVYQQTRDVILEMRKNEEWDRIRYEFSVPRLSRSSCYLVIAPNKAKMILCLSCLNLSNAIVRG